MKKLSVYLSCALAASSLMAAAPNKVQSDCRTGVSIGGAGLGLSYDTPKMYSNLSTSFLNRVQAATPSDHTYNNFLFRGAIGPKMRLTDKWFQTVALDAGIDLIDDHDAYDDGAGAARNPYRIGVTTGYLVNITPKLQGSYSLMVVSYSDNGEKGDNNIKSTRLFSAYTTGLIYYFR